MTLETKTAQERKEAPVFSGVLAYFPDALVEVAELSRIGNDQHNPGQALHWAKEKSTDEKDALTRHLLQSGTRDTDGVRHSAKVAWRALANLQREIDAERASPAQQTPITDREVHNAIQSSKGDREVSRPGRAVDTRVKGMPI